MAKTQGGGGSARPSSRWPAPILVVACAIALIGLLALPGYKTSYDVRPYLPASSPANVGYTAAERHFSRARLEPELLMVETDHDMRNPTDMLILDKVAKAVAHYPGSRLVQGITRPLGTPINHSSIPFQISTQSASQIRRTSNTRKTARATCWGRPASWIKRFTFCSNNTGCSSSSPPPRTTKPKNFTRRWTSSTNYETRSQILTTSSGRSIATSILRSTAYDIPICFALRSAFEAPRQCRPTQRKI